MVALCELPMASNEAVGPGRPPSSPCRGRRFISSLMLLLAIAGVRGRQPLTLMTGRAVRQIPWVALTGCPRNPRARNRCLICFVAARRCLGVLTDLTRPQFVRSKSWNEREPAGALTSWKKLGRKGRKEGRREDLCALACSDESTAESTPPWVGEGSRKCCAGRNSGGRPNIGGHQIIRAPPRISASLSP
jgi:hypothetical protein